MTDSVLVGLFGLFGLAVLFWILDRHVTAHWLDED
jgi:hypothetical protein